MKYILIFFLFVMTLSAKAQFNRNLKPKPQDSTIILAQQSELNFRPPEFPGGIAKLYKYINKKMKMPRDAKDEKVNGKVFVSFLVDSLGRIEKESILIVKSLTKSCDNEAIRLMRECPNWNPGVDVKTKRRIAMRYTLPIVFRASQ